MPVKNQFVTDDLSRTMLKKNYSMKHNDNGSGDFNLMETIENISEGMATDTNSLSFVKDRQHEIGIKQSLNKNRNSNRKQISEKNYSGKNKKLKELNIPNNSNVTNTNTSYDLSKTNEKNNTIGNMNNIKNENENKNNSSHTSYANISQIYDTDDSNVKEEQEICEEKIQYENSFISLLYAFVFIVVGMIIISHMYLDEDHIIIKKFAVLKISFLNTLRNAPFGRNIMKIVTSINSGIDNILNELTEKATVTKPYIEAFKKANNEFSVLSLICLFSFFVITLFINIICNIVEVKYKRNSNKKDTKKNEKKNTQVLVTNKMTIEEFEDRTYTYKELKKLHEDPDFLCLKSKRAGEGVAAWNWQSRIGNPETKKAYEEICSDIELSDVTEE